MQLWVQGRFPGSLPPWLVVPVIRRCQRPIRIWLVNYSHLHIYKASSGWPCRTAVASTTIAGDRVMSSGVAPEHAWRLGRVRWHAVAEGASHSTGARVSADRHAATGAAVRKAHAAPQVARGVG